VRYERCRSGESLCDTDIPSPALASAFRNVGPFPTR
jgi:hypothetical protein